MRSFWSKTYHGNEDTSQKTTRVWDDNVTTGQEPDSGKCIQLALHVTKASSLDNEPSVKSEWILIMWAHIHIKVRRNIIFTDPQRWKFLWMLYSL
jgi:hypothetical protein